MTTHSARSAVYEAAEDYDGTFHVTEVAGGATVAVCPTWEVARAMTDSLNAAEALGEAIRANR